MTDAFAARQQALLRAMSNIGNRPIIMTLTRDQMLTLLGALVSGLQPGCDPSLRESYHPVVQKLRSALCADHKAAFLEAYEAKP